MRTHEVLAGEDRASASAIPATTFDVFADSPTTTVSLGLYSGLPDPEASARPAQGEV